MTALERSVSSMQVACGGCIPSLPHQLSPFHCLKQNGKCHATLPLLPAPPTLPPLQQFWVRLCPFPMRSPQYHVGSHTCHNISCDFTDNLARNQHHLAQRWHCCQRHFSHGGSGVLMGVTHWRLLLPEVVASPHPTPK